MDIKVYEEACYVFGNCDCCVYAHGGKCNKDEHYPAVKHTANKILGEFLKNIGETITTYSIMQIAEKYGITEEELRSGTISQD